MDNLSFFNENKNTLILDIGSSKISALLASTDENGKIIAHNYFVLENPGALIKGSVININKTESGIKEVIAKIEESNDTRIENVVINISGTHIKTFSKSTYLNKADNNLGFTKQQIEQMTNDVLSQPLPAEYKVLHINNQEFKINDMDGVTDAIGMVGDRIESEFKLITGNTTQISNLTLSVDRCNLNVVSKSYSGIAAASAVLREHDKQAGTCVVDLGYGTTDVVIYTEGFFRHAFTLPIGAAEIIKDLGVGCAIMPAEATKLLMNYGMALLPDNFENEKIPTLASNGRDIKLIEKSNVVKIIRERVLDIFQMIDTEIEKSLNANNLSGGIVLVGGLANLPYIDKACEFFTGIPTRIGTPEMYLSNGYMKSLSTPEVATLIGLFIIANNELVPQSPIAKIEENTTPDEEFVPEKENVDSKSNFFGNFKKSIESFLTPNSDTDF
jgi:cell division protein FtsA